MSAGIGWIQNALVKADEENIDLGIVTIEIAGSRATLALEGPDLQAEASRAGMRVIAKIISTEMPDLAEKIIDTMQQLDLEAKG